MALIRSNTLGSRSKSHVKTGTTFSSSSYNNSNEVSIFSVIKSDDSVIGLVSIPGMMTGAILGGATISQAVKYQQIIMFLISATTLLSVTLSAAICVTVCIDGNHRLRPDRVTQEKAWMWKIRDGIGERIVKGCIFAWRRITCRPYLEEDQNHVEGSHSHS